MKVCVECGTPYEPTGYRDTRCLNCRKIFTGGRDADTARHIFNLLKLNNGLLCAVCGKNLTKIVLDPSKEELKKQLWVVDHKDGNHSNHDPNNFQLLCRRCHAGKHKLGGEISHGKEWRIKKAISAREKWAAGVYDHRDNKPVNPKSCAKCSAMFLAKSGVARYCDNCCDSRRKKRNDENYSLN